MRAPNTMHKTVWCAVEECAQSVSSSALRCALSDMAAELISLSYLCFQLLPPEKVAEREVEQKANVAVEQR